MMSVPVAVVIILYARKLVPFIVMVLLLMIIPYALLNPNKPVFGSESVFKADNARQYFVYHKEYFRKSYLRAAEYSNTRSCRSIGLYLGRDDWEYPIWKLLKSKGQDEFRIRHIEVKNVSRKVVNAAEKFKNCLILTTSLDDKLLRKMGFQALRKNEYLNVYKRASKKTN